MSAAAAANAALGTKKADDAVVAKPKYQSIRDLPRNELIVVVLIFAATGSSAAQLVRPLISFLLTNVLAWTGIDPSGSLKGGPWAFRLLYLCFMTPTYTCLLLTYGAICGRFPYFAAFAVKMWSRMLPKPALGAMKKVLKVE